MAVTNSWADIAFFYQETSSDPNVDAHLREALVGIWTLAERIRDTDLSGQLYGWTSMLDLCIQQTNRPYPFGDHLRIVPREAGKVEFRYIDTAIERRQWNRIVSAEDTVDRFERFMDQLRWVPSVRSMGH